MAALPVQQAFSINRAISHGWEAFKRNPAAWIIGGFLLSLTGQGGGGGGNNLGNQSSYESSGDPSLDQFLQGMQAGLAATQLGIACFCGIVGLLIHAWIQPGFVRMSRNMVVNGSAEMGTLFTSTDCFVRQLLWDLLAGIISFGAAAISAVPGGALIAAAFLVAGDGEPNIALLIGGFVLVFSIMLPVLVYVGIGLMFGSYAIALEDSGPMQALERSWGMAAGNRLHLFLFNLVTGLFNLLGVCACCVGVWITRPVVETGKIEGWLLATDPNYENFAFTKDLGL